MKYYIVIRGCDDVTPVLLDLNEEESSALKKLAESAATISNGQCMPDISYYSITDEAYENHIKWKEIMQKRADSYWDDTELTEEEREFYYNFYDEYWVEHNYIDHFDAYEYRKNMNKEG